MESQEEQAVARRAKELGAGATRLGAVVMSVRGVQGGDKGNQGGHKWALGVSCVSCLFF